MSSEQTDEAGRSEIGKWIQQRFGLRDEVSSDALLLILQEPVDGIASLLRGAGRNVSKGKLANIRKTHVPLLKAKIEAVLKSTTPTPSDSPDPTFTYHYDEELSEQPNPQTIQWVFQFFHRALMDDQAGNFQNLKHLRIVGTLLPHEQRAAYADMIERLEQELPTLHDSCEDESRLLTTIINRVNVWLKATSLLIVPKVTGGERTASETISPLLEKIEKIQVYNGRQSSVEALHIRKSHTSIPECGHLYMGTINAVVIDLDAVDQEILMGEIILGISSSQRKVETGNPRAMNIHKERYKTLWNRHKSSGAVRASLMKRILAEEVRHGFDAQASGHTNVGLADIDDVVCSVIRDDSLPSKLMQNTDQLSEHQRYRRMQVALEYAGKLAGASVSDPRDSVAEWRMYIRMIETPESSIGEDMCAQGGHTSHTINAKITIICLAQVLDLISGDIDENRVWNNTELAELATTIEEGDAAKLQEAVETLSHHDLVRPIGEE